MADPNPFDQFDAPATTSAPIVSAANPFDQFDVAPGAHDSDAWVRSNLIAQGIPADKVSSMDIGPLDRASAALHAVTSAVSSAYTGGLSDKAAAAGGVVGSTVKSGISDAMKHVANWAAQSSGLPSLYNMGIDGAAPMAAGDTQQSATSAAPIVPSVVPAVDGPATSPDPTFASALADQRQATSDFSAAHPVVSGMASGIGMAGTIGLGAGLNPATLGGKMAAGAGIGGVTGAASGFGNAPDGSTLKDTAIGAGLGTVLGGAAPALVTAASPIVGRIVQALRPGAAEDSAVNMIGNAIRQDAGAGGPGIPEISQSLADNAAKPVSIVDYAGANVQGLGGQVARAPGAGRQTAIDFLNNRDQGAGARLIGDVQNGISNGDSAFNTQQTLMAQRQAASAPAYKAAGIPSDAADFATAPVIDNPEVSSLLAKSADVQSAIAQAKRFPAYADLPDNSMVLLDKAYKNIGGLAQQTKQSGNGPLANDYNSLRMQLKNAITGGDPSHPYQAALDAFSGPSASLDAAKSGQSFLTMHPDELTSTISGLSPGDAEFFKAGAADALTKKIASVGIQGDEARQLQGNDYLKQQLRPLFGSDDDYNGFLGNAASEAKMFATKVSTIGNSATAARLAQDGSGAGSGALAGLGQAATGAVTGEPGLMSIGVMKLLSSLTKSSQIPTPAANAAAARLLFSSDPTANASTLARALAASQAPSKSLASAIPLSTLPGSLYPRYALSPNGGQGTP